MAIELLIMLLLIFGTAGMGHYLFTIALPGLRTGKLQARGRIYSRSDEPVRFWFGIVFWFLMFFMMLICTGMFLVTSITKFNGFA